MTRTVEEKAHKARVTQNAQMKIENSQIPNGACGCECDPCNIGYNRGHCHNRNRGCKVAP
jgi:hypothetical protein